MLISIILGALAVTALVVIILARHKAKAMSECIIQDIIDNPDDFVRPDETPKTTEPNEIKKTLDDVYNETAGAALDYMYEHSAELRLTCKNDLGDVGPEPEPKPDTDNTFTPNDTSDIEVVEELDECSIPDTIARVDIKKAKQKIVNKNSDLGFTYTLRMNRGKALKPTQKDGKNTVYHEILLPAELENATEDEKYKYAVKFISKIMEPTPVKRKPLPKFDEEKFLGHKPKKSKLKVLNDGEWVGLPEEDTPNTKKTKTTKVKKETKKPVKKTTKQVSKPKTRKTTKKEKV